METLNELGWDASFRSAFEPWKERGCLAARVAAEHQHIYRVLTGRDDPLAVVTGRFRHKAESRVDFPAVGDWVAIRLQESGDGRVTIQGVLPRKSAFVRKGAGTGVEGQVVAANIDLVFLVSGLDSDFNPRRIERYLALAWESGARPVILLNKADVCEDVDARVRELERVAQEVPVHVLSCRKNEGLEAVGSHLQPGRTAALLGSSGVGKSTLINRLVGRDVQRTKEVRASDDRGRHATTHRQLVRLPSGGLLVDTPGMREIQLWDAGEGLGETFEDVAALAEDCRFRNCKHQDEPGCAVKAAVAEGRFSEERLTSFGKLDRELAHVERQRDRQAALEEKKKWRSVHKLLRRHKPRE